MSDVLLWYIFCIYNISDPQVGRFGSCSPYDREGLVSSRYCQLVQSNREERLQVPLPVRASYRPIKNHPRLPEEYSPGVALSA